MTQFQIGDFFIGIGGSRIWEVIDTYPVADKVWGRLTPDKEHPDDEIEERMFFLDQVKKVVIQ